MHSGYLNHRYHARCHARRNYDSRQRPTEQDQDRVNTFQYAGRIPVIIPAAVVVHAYRDDAPCDRTFICPNKLASIILTDTEKTRTDIRKVDPLDQCYAQIEILLPVILTDRMRRRVISRWQLLTRCKQLKVSKNYNYQFESFEMYQDYIERRISKNERNSTLHSDTNKCGYHDTYILFLFILMKNT